MNGEPIDNPAASKGLIDALRKGEAITPTVEDSSGNSREIEIPSEILLDKMDEIDAMNEE